jgi:hypothetical protein
MLPPCCPEARFSYMLGVKQLLGASMPKGPQGQKRPADTVANAIRVAKILTGEIEEDTGADDGKDKSRKSAAPTSRVSVTRFQSESLPINYFVEILTFDLIQERRGDDAQKRFVSRG